MPETVKLTNFARGSGCGCKIAPEVLHEILGSSKNQMHPDLLVGYETSDDAAVYDMGNGKALLSTADFFTPVVDDAFDFGRIAAANALSDVYAMGGRPLLALSILGWPVEKISSELAGEVLKGAQKICEEAKIALAGGHSIDASEPIFGLSVTGEVEIKNLKRNSTAEAGNAIFLTKKLGTGILSAAQKRGLAEEVDLKETLEVMTSLNAIGSDFGTLDYITAMTDVTGFGFLGHLIEMCQGSNLSAEVEYSKVPRISNLSHYASKMIYPDITTKNWNHVETRVSGIIGESLLTLCDPQTSGGLLVAVRVENENDFLELCRKKGLMLETLGQFTERKEKLVYIS